MYRFGGRRAVNVTSISSGDQSARSVQTGIWFVQEQHVPYALMGKGCVHGGTKKRNKKRGNYKKEKN